MSPWYLPVVVNGQMPVTSPSAQSPSPARRCASTGIPWRFGLDADGLEPDAVDPRPATGRDEQAVAAQLGAVVDGQDEVVAVPSRLRRAHAEHQLDAVATEDLAERLAQRCGLVGEHVLGQVDERRPRRRGGARPGPSRRRPDRRPGSAGGGGPRSSRSPRGSSTRPRAPGGPGTGGTIGSAPVATTTCRAVYRVAPTSTAPGPASRPSPRSRSMPRSVSHFSALVSVWFETMKSRHASAAATSTCALAAASLAAWAASPGRSRVLDGMHAQ